MDLQPRSQSATSGEARLDQAIPIHSIVVAAEDQVSCKLGEEFAVLRHEALLLLWVKAFRGACVGFAAGSAIPGPSPSFENSILEKYEVGGERTEKDLRQLLTKMRTCGLIGSGQNAHLARASSEKRSPLMQEVPAVDATGEVTHRAPSKKPYLEPGLNEVRHYRGHYLVRCLRPAWRQSNQQ